jgi:glutamine synthetase
MAMSSLRMSAIEESLKRKPIEVTPPSSKISDYFGIYVFDKLKMEKYLSADAFNAVIEAIELGARIDRKMADQVASGMKSWAMSHGVTHYTHWFQPLTEGTAEKHDAFMEFTSNGQVIEQFSGSY